MKDEVLDKALPSDATVIPRYDVIDANGNVVVANAQLKLKNPVLQEGTPLDKTTLLKDTTAQILGLPNTATPDDILQVTAKQTGQVINQFGQLNAIKTTQTSIYPTVNFNVQDTGVSAWVGDQWFNYNTKINADSSVFVNWKEGAKASAVIINLKTKHTTNISLCNETETETYAVYPPEYLSNGDVMCACSSGYAIIDHITSEVKLTKLHRNIADLSGCTIARLVPITANSYCVLYIAYEYQVYSMGLAYVLSGVVTGEKINLSGNSVSQYESLLRQGYLPYEYVPNLNRLRIVCSDTRQSSATYDIKLLEFYPDSTGMHKTANDKILLPNINLRQLYTATSITTFDSFYIFVHKIQQVSAEELSLISLIRVDRQTLEVTQPSIPIKEIIPSNGRSYAYIYMSEGSIWLPICKNSAYQLSLCKIDSKTLNIQSEESTIGGMPIAKFFGQEQFLGATSRFPFVQSYLNSQRSLDVIQIDTPKMLATELAIYDKIEKKAYAFSSTLKLISGYNAIDISRATDKNMLLSIIDLSLTEIKAAKNNGIMELLS